MKVKKLHIVQVSLSSSPPSSLPLSGSVLWERKKSSSTRFVQMFNWISHNEKCIANYFSVYHAICISSKQFKSLACNLQNWMRKQKNIAIHLHNFKINGTRTKGSTSRVTVFSDIVQCTYSSFMRIYIDKLIGNAIY